MKFKTRIIYVEKSSLSHYVPFENCTKISRKVVLLIFNSSVPMKDVYIETSRDKDQ